MTTNNDLARYVEVAAVRRDGTAPAGATTAIRLMGLLPAHWSCTAEVGTDHVRLRIVPGDTADRADVHRTVSGVFADTALCGWAQQG
ncbi:hypothetical protein GCM10010329_27950 [Streptomyces spiroverticillatus]|uniref:Uncharacterized protein n=1 Tax=Streptomyces finlayi TaxID=67296 RepID=A0A918WVR5_9ACTN|nr:hypothetical protein [Streptomyces finlayi]GHA03861.1 hypothetical protein GCM10010329_27950 [Streptomyces spiroverticillatus]GHC87989.1 hypothetical protein GCM10010334_20360 [Streptomyces finlayi]